MAFTITTDHDAPRRFGVGYDFDILDGGEVTATLNGRPVLIVAAGEWRAIEIDTEPREPSEEQLQVVQEAVFRHVGGDRISIGRDGAVAIWKAAVDG